MLFLQINVPIQLNIASKYCVDELYYVVSVSPDIILPKVVICFSQLNISKFWLQAWRFLQQPCDTDTSVTQALCAPMYCRWRPEDR